MSAKHEKGLIDLGIDHDYTGFDVVIFSKWFLAFINEAKVDLTKTDLDLCII